ncbi:MAG: hypothetical protein ABJZ55_11720 [Fuerstiella sp.]
MSDFRHGEGMREFAKIEIAFAGNVDVAALAHRRVENERIREFHLFLKGK